MTPKKIWVCIFTLFIFCIFFTGCSFVDNISIKLGLKNTDFDYIKQGKINKIVIQSTRDRGFRFIVTDKTAVSNLYSILSSAKSVKEKSALKPDYIFEMYEEGSKVHKFNYIAGLDKKDGGNLYNDDKTYIVSSRIDNDIIKYFWNISIPKDFEKIYYKNTIIKTAEEYAKYYKMTYNKNISSVGINLDDDVYIQKFILSSDVDNFKDNLKKEVPYVSVIENTDNDNSDVTMTVKTQGYKLTLYKAVITFSNNKDKSEKKYYVLNESNKGIWVTTIYDEKTKPDTF